MLSKRYRVTLIKCVCTYVVSYSASYIHVCKMTYMCLMTIQEDQKVLVSLSIRKQVHTGRLGDISSPFDLA